MNRPLALLPFVCLLATAVAGQSAQNAAAGGRTREPVAVKASFDLTWAAVAKVVNGEMINDRFIILEESEGYRRGAWIMRVPSGDFRAASWASCRSGGEPPVAPRAGRAEVVVRGDTASATVLVTVDWNGQNPNDVQQPMQCRDLGEYAKGVEGDIRKNAERAARR